MANNVQTEIDENVQWFRDNDGYAETQSQLPLYRYIELMVSREIAGQKHVLDIGNGGFFNYDTTLASRVTAVDLFLTDGPGPVPNTVFKRGSILDIPFPDGTFDCILLQNVLHHVTGRTVDENYANLTRSIAELYRCVATGGKAVIIESTVGQWFLPIEKMLFPIAIRFKRGGHPVTFQFAPDQLLTLAKAQGFDLLEYADIPSRGLFILQYGHRWPTCLTPARPIKLVLRK